MCNMLFRLDELPLPYNGTFSLNEAGEFRMCQRASVDIDPQSAFDFTGTVWSQEDLDALVLDLVPVKTSVSQLLTEQLKDIDAELRVAQTRSKRATTDETTWVADLYALRCETAYNAIQTLLGRLQCVTNFFEEGFSHGYHPVS